MDTAALLQGPALPPPEGVVPNVTNHSGEQVWRYVVTCFCTIVPGCLLLLRLYTKLRILQKVEATDYVVVLAFLLFVAMGGIGARIFAEGAAVHMWNLQLKNFIKMQYWLWINEIVYGPTIFFVKLGILLQYLRLFAPTKALNPFMYISARVIIAITLVYYIMSTFVTAFACSPRERIWNPLITEGHCLNNNALVLATCVFNIISDIMILLLPARAVWKLQIPRKKKIGIVLLFAIGLLACVANILIIYYINLMGEANADVSYNAAWFSCWGYVEICLGILVTCTLSLPKFLEAKGDQVRKGFSSLTRPLRSFPSMATMRRSTKSDASSQDKDFYGRMPSDDLDLRYQPSSQDLEAYPLPCGADRVTLMNKG